jgi:hypothetical protein
MGSSGAGSSGAGSSGAGSPYIGFSRADWRLIGFAVLAAAAAGVTHYADLGGTIAPFVVSALVLLSPLVGASFTLVLSPLLIAVLIMAVVVTVIMVLDGESNWLEGATLIVLYGIIATAFWWG